MRQRRRRPGTKAGGNHHLLIELENQADWGDEMLKILRAGYPAAVQIAVRARTFLQCPSVAVAPRKRLSDRIRSAA